MSTIGSIYNFGRVARLTSPHQATHTQVHPTKDHPSQLFKPMLCVLEVFPPQTHHLFSITSLYQDNTNFGSTSWHVSPRPATRLPIRPCLITLP
jgi:hypothetical protein